ncbi:unnamed protein product [Pieris brassicae]|uniref:Uncharacterized protein n=1 Tax=Pieris brassicae TaxID=7116 RepID=A0A9P0TXC3_PIEBR|nr:unnamed protein product [Pieris brassicae]
MQTQGLDIKLTAKAMLIKMKTLCEVQSPRVQPMAALQLAYTSCSLTAHWGLPRPFTSLEGTRAHPTLTKPHKALTTFLF